MIHSFFYASKFFRVNWYIFFPVQDENWNVEVSWIAEPINLESNIANDSDLNDKASDEFGVMWGNDVNYSPVSEEEQETSGDFGSGGSVVLLDDLEEEPETAKKDKEGKLKIHVRAANEDDEDEDDDKDDEIGYIW